MPILVFQLDICDQSPVGTSWTDTWQFRTITFPSLRHFHFGNELFLEDYFGNRQCLFEIIIFIRSYLPNILLKRHTIPFNLAVNISPCGLILYIIKCLSDVVRGCLCWVQHRYVFTFTYGKQNKSETRSKHSFKTPSRPKGNLVTVKVCQIAKLEPTQQTINSLILTCAGAKFCLGMEKKYNCCLFMYKERMTSEFQLPTNSLTN